jgi:hypothetical protein
MVTRKKVKIPPEMKHSVNTAESPELKYKKNIAQE